MSHNLLIVVLHPVSFVNITPVVLMKLLIYQKKLDFEWVYAFPIPLWLVILRWATQGPMALLSLNVFPMSSDD